MTREHVTGFPIDRDAHRFVVLGDLNPLALQREQDLVIDCSAQPLHDRPELHEVEDKPCFRVEPTLQADADAVVVAVKTFAPVARQRDEMRGSEGQLVLGDRDAKITAHFSHVGRDHNVASSLTTSGSIPTLRPMPFQIDEMLVLEIGQARFSDGTKFETSTSIGRVLVVESFPAVLNLRLAIKFRSDTKCTVACDAHVIDPAGRRLPSGHLRFVAEPGADREELPLPRFTASSKGAYRVELHVNNSPTPVESTDILVDVAASLA